MGDAGISRGVIVLVGAGGRGLWRKHVEGTMEIIDEMDLGRDDLVFLSRLLVRPDMPYAGMVRDPLDDGEMDSQEEELAEALRARGVRTAPYDIRESIY